MSVVETLKAARALIDTPEKWTRGWYARDAAGRSVDSGSHDAICFCSAGALNRAVKDHGNLTIDEADAVESAMDVLNRVAKELGSDGFIALNDQADHATVMRMFDLAIASAEAAQAGGEP